MNARDVVKAAALLAARHAVADLPASLVRWSDEAQAQGEGDTPQVTLGEISLIPEGPVSRRRSVAVGGELSQRMLQTYIWKVQVKSEGWKLDSALDNNPFLFARKMRFGWYLDTVADALLDLDTDEDERTPVKLVDEVGQILPMRQTVRGQTLPVYVFEIEFRYVEHDVDPTSVGVIESVALSGTLGGEPVDIIATES